DKRTLVLMDKLMSRPVELESGSGTKFTVRLEVNVDFDSTKVEKLLDYLNIVNVYDWDGNKIENDGRIQEFNITGAQLKVMSVMKILDKLSKIKTVVNNVLVVLVLLDIVAAVLIIYFIWRRADDRRELRENALREAEIHRVTGKTEEEVKASKKKKKKKK
nr:hypothetical protein [Eubacterium sp.]